MQSHVLGGEEAYRSEEAELRPEEDFELILLTRVGAGEGGGRLAYK